MLRFFTTLKSDEITSIAIGGFDGVHLGHQELIKELDTNGTLLVIDKGFSNLTPGESKCKYIKNGCIFLDLNDIKDLTPKEFVVFLKSTFANLKKVIVGYDFSFGKDRSGNAEFLKNYFETKVIDEVKIDGISVHSKVIRDYIKKGDIKSANKLLGRAYTIVGKTIKGQGIGGKELVHTINLVPEKYLLPKDGVYATKTLIGDGWYDSVTFIGKRESTDGNFAVETHLIDSKIDFQPKRVEVTFYDFVRDNKKFDTLSELKKQILDDIKYVRSILNKDCFDNK